MEEIWKRIEAWLRANAPEILGDLRPGASDDDLRRAEKTLGAALPETLAASYRIHDGARGGAAPLVGPWRLLSLEDVTKEWEGQQRFSQEQSDLDEERDDQDDETEPAPGVREGWWRGGWVPVASNSSGDFVCVDLDPAPGGKRGQVISFLHADPARALLAPDFGAWLGGFAGDLESGKYKVEGRRLSKVG